MGPTGQAAQNGLISSRAGSTGSAVCLMPDSGGTATHWIHSDGYKIWEGLDCMVRYLPLCSK